MSEIASHSAEVAAKSRKSTPEHSGLEDMIAAESKICFIDGINAKLIYRGYSIDELAGKASFEEVVYLLYYGKLPNKSELQNFKKTLSTNSAVNPKIIKRMKELPKTVHPMHVMRTMVSALSFYDKDTDQKSYEANLKRAVRLTGQMSTLVAAWARISKGKSPISPKKGMGYAENFLYMATGKKPDALSIEAMDLYLVLLADHELNASTFACRVTASTLSDYYSAITSAIGTLKGPLHGGANEKVINMLLQIKNPAKVEEYIQDKMDRKIKIMGFGHRVYKVKDPRSPLLKDMCEKVCQKTGNQHLYEMSVKIENIVTPAKKLPSNVDFYSATVLYCLGIAPAMFTPLFVLSRLSGYTAHYLEQISDNRLIRPRATYSGDMNLSFTPLNQR